MFTILWPEAVGVLAGVVLVTAMTACTSPHQYIDVTCSKMAGDTILDRELAIQCQTFRRAEAATAVYNEVSLLMKSYRACLAKYEQTPNRAKENCSEYPKALSNVACSRVAGEITLGPEVATQCHNSRQEEAATAVYNEAMLLVKSYRSCLEKYEHMPTSKGKDYCAQYPKALKEIGLQIKEAPEPGAENSPARGTPAKLR
ncbi:hypothetical protein [Petrachloros mirabilis]